MQNITGAIGKIIIAIIIIVVVIHKFNQKNEEKMNLSQTLQQFDLFAGSDNIEHMLGCLQAKVKEYEREEYILQPGETPSAMGVNARRPSAVAPVCAPSGTFADTG